MKISYLFYCNWVVRIERILLGYTTIMAMILNVVCYNSREGKETGFVIFRYIWRKDYERSEIAQKTTSLLLCSNPHRHFTFEYFSFSQLLFNQSVKEVDYGTFLDMVEQGQVEEVEIQNNSIVFKSEQGEKGNLYKTGTIEDPKLVDRLHLAEVKFTKVIPKETSPLLSFILNVDSPINHFHCDWSMDDEKNAKQGRGRKCPIIWEEQGQNICGSRIGYNV